MHLRGSIIKDTVKSFTCIKMNMVEIKKEREEIKNTVDAA
jgi:hypothetical protein